MKVKDLLQDGRGEFRTLESTRSVDEAVKLMSGYQLSGLVIEENGASRGIFTERDLVRCHILFPQKDLDRISVADVMTAKLIVARPEDSVEDAMGMMMKAKIRHLPVVEGAKITSLLTLEDLVKTHVGTLTQELHYLQDYIADLQDAAHD